MYVKIETVRTQTVFIQHTLTQRSNQFTHTRKKEKRKLYKIQAKADGINIVRPLWLNIHSLDDLDGTDPYSGIDTKGIGSAFPLSFPSGLHPYLIHKDRNRIFITT